MRKKPVKLTVKERADLERYCGTGVHSVRLVNRAKIILALDTSGGRTPERQEAIAQRLGIIRQTRITGEMEARIIAPACGQAPNGYARWTLRLPAAKCVELRYSGTMSRMTISNLLKNAA
jgi:hypothetical protein